MTDQEFTVIGGRPDGWEYAGPGEGEDEYVFVDAAGRHVVVVRKVRDGVFDATLEATDDHPTMREGHVISEAEGMSYRGISAAVKGMMIGSGKLDLDGDDDDS